MIELTKHTKEISDKIDSLLAVAKEIHKAFMERNLSCKAAATALAESAPGLRKVHQDKLTDELAKATNAEVTFLGQEPNGVSYNVTKTVGNAPVTIRVFVKHEENCIKTVMEKAHKAFEDVRKAKKK